MKQPTYTLWVCPECRVGEWLARMPRLCRDCCQERDFQPFIRTKVSLIPIYTKHAVAHKIVIYRYGDRIDAELEFYK
jgi:hypothetical protein